jgi:hypothetical protein
MIGCFTSHPRKLEIEKFECFLMGNEHQGRRFGRGMESKGVRTKKKVGEIKDWRIAGREDKGGSKNKVI